MSNKNRRLSRIVTVAMATKQDADEIHEFWKLFDVNHGGALAPPFAIEAIATLVAHGMSVKATDLTGGLVAFILAGRAVDLVKKLQIPTAVKFSESTNVPLQNAVIYAAVAIDKACQGMGLLEKMLTRLRESMNSSTCVYFYIRSDNHQSIRAHTKIGGVDTLKDKAGQVVSFFHPSLRETEMLCFCMRQLS